MAIQRNYSKDSVQVIRERKKEIVYERQELFGHLFSFWRKVDERYIGQEFRIEVKGDFHEYDKLFINGEEVKITPNEK